MKDFLERRYGKEEGARLYDLAQELNRKMLSEVGDISRSRYKVLSGMLMPRVALYKTLLNEGYSKEEALGCLEEHMVTCSAEDLKKKYRSLDSLPCAWFLFKKGFTTIVAKSDLWDADIEKDKKNEFSVTMRRCFWHDTFEKYGCPEMCRFACQCDDITYGDLKHIAFSRTQTLGTGGSCCDFHFTKKKPN